MRCPYCGHAGSRVLESRPAGEGRAVRRRRKCLRCGGRFTTFERAGPVHRSWHDDRVQGRPGGPGQEHPAWDPGWPPATSGA